MQLVDTFEVIEVRRTQLLDKKIDPKLHCDNYCKDMRCLVYYDCSYKTNVTHIIDLLCHHDDRYGVEYPGDD